MARKGVKLMKKSVRVTAVALAATGLTLSAIAPALADEATSTQTSVTTTPTEPTTVDAPPVTPVVPAQTPVTAAAPAAPTRVQATRKFRGTTNIPVSALLGGSVVLNFGDRGPAVKAVQDRLYSLGIMTKRNGIYDHQTASGVARFQEKFRGFEYDEVDTMGKSAYKRLIALTRRGDQVPRVCKTSTKMICVSKKQRIIRLFVRGRLVMGLDARFGRPGEPTREGRFTIFRKVKDDVSAQYHSPMPYSSYFSGGQAFHFSKYFKMDGYWGASHGCINIRDYKGAANFWKNTPLGTSVLIYR